ncbi:MAG: hypothetical protein EPN23_02810 [Verrucomicrobia bacterium]|nr:MAG: hypothetical protein EPN23_02810 [Verrucomicrobiota bacterium]
MLLPFSRLWKRSPCFVARGENMKKMIGLLALLMLGARLVAAEDLAAGFVNPPASAKPHTWWHWMDGNITKEGITADLDALARVGVGGAQIFNAAGGIPIGPVQYNSPEWRELVKHAASEAQRLGLELCIHNCAGWSSSGAPWNTPEHGMQIVVTSETRVKGPTKFDAKLPQPPTQFDCYRDIAVLAWPTPATELVTMKQCAPKVTSSAKHGNAANLITGKEGTALTFALPTPQEPQFIQLEFAQPFTARMLSLKPAGGMRGCRGRLESSDDGKKFREIESFTLPKGDEIRIFTFAPVSARFFRVLFLSTGSKMKALTLRALELAPRLGIEDFAGKAFYDRGSDVHGTTAATAQPDEVIPSGALLDLSGKMDKSGRLVWAAPEGDWTVVRFGYTPNGRSNHPAPKSGTGLECDKLSAEAAQAHWDGGMGKLIAELGPLAGKVLNNVLIDSYEVGTQNWTTQFRGEFQKRRGYDLVRFLPVLAGRIVDSPAITDRFLWDFRRTIADLFAENYSKKFAELAHQNGMLYSVEPYGNCPSDDLQYGEYADIPMSEFWPGGGNPGNAKHAAALGHVYGRKFVGAESFTAGPEVGKWLKDPYSLKAQGDLVWCSGVNRFIFHRYAHQPWTNPTRFPGMTMGQWGTHFERTLTWWEQGSAWLKYIARSQYLLQSGLFVGDVLFFAGEGAPNSGRAGELAPGYDYDTCNTEALLNLVSVKDGRLVFPSGMSYRVLALPDDGAMTPALLRKLKQLVDAGATIVGSKPAQSPSLTGWPQCDAEVRQLADELWRKSIQNKTATEALTALGIKPDFVCADASAKLTYIHRVAEGADIYFVSNQKEVAGEVSCTFRISGKQPELWHPDTGVIEKAPVFTEQAGRTTVPLRFAPAGSVFVVFRQPADAAHIVAAHYTPANTTTTPPPELAIVKAEYGFFGTTNDEGVDVTTAVKQLVGQGQRRILAGNALAHDPAPGDAKELRIEFLTGGKRKVQTVSEGQTLELPANAKVLHASYGVLGNETEPSAHIANVTAKLAGLVKDGALVVMANNKLTGHDPAPMVVKELRVEYRVGSVQKIVHVSENKTLTLPDENERPTPPPAYDLIVNGKTEVLAWQPGVIELTTAAGQTLKAEAQTVPAPQEITGPWELSFPPNWGAPAKVMLDKLISWTEHPDAGVKYFSGTATYRKNLEFKPQNLKSKIFLDLGLLKNIAEVKLNGHDLGILWKPPFRIEVTDALRDGQNELEVRITNLWPNRLIGDEQLPDDREWNGIQLKKWPPWVLAGKPSPTGRFTFTTWHHWTQADQPLPSGLFGPVLLRTAVQVAAQP